MKSNVLTILEQLVACDTQNPPREISADHPVFRVVSQHLSQSSSIELNFVDHGRGRVSLLAQRGMPAALFNVHLDTVPVGGNWKRDPFVVTIEDDRAFGRGTCDIKGAAACLIAAATSTDSDIAILFSTDEEGSESCCVKEFCRSPVIEPFAKVVVAEPTECQIVLGHRGYLSVTGLFTGAAGHTSQHGLLENSANHKAIHWMNAALKAVKEFERESLSGQSVCFNIGRIDGGVKNNVIAENCKVTFSARLPAGYENGELLTALTTSIVNDAKWTVPFSGAPLPSQPSRKEEAAATFAELSLPNADDVDFWTEAAIFSDLGSKCTAVLGPGHIVQAHTSDEWVSIQQLQQCAQMYLQIMNHGQ